MKRAPLKILISIDVSLTTTVFLELVFHNDFPQINDLGDNTKFMKSIFVFGGEYDMIKIYFKGSISSKRLGE